MKLKVFNALKTAKGLNELEFKDLGTFNDGGAGVFWSGVGGPSPWEMHPDCDELLHVLEGMIDVEVLPSDSGDVRTATVKAGDFLVVPRGCWHRQHIRERSTEFYLTPGQTLHSVSDDPRIDG